jgi:hypothetical protein
MRLFSAGKTPTTTEYADGLVAINSLLDALRNESLMCYATQVESLTLAASTDSYSIGPSGDLDTTRPTGIEQAWIRDGGIDYPVRLISDEQYSAIPDKSAESDWPTEANYRATMPTGTLYVYPLPNGAATMVLRTRIPLGAFTATTDEVSLPPGWEEMLVFNLAVRWAPEFETQASQTVVDVAMSSKASIKRTNSRPMLASSDLAMALGAAGCSNIITG